MWQCFLPLEDLKENKLVVAYYQQKVLEWFKIFRFFFYLQCLLILTVCIMQKIN